MAHVDTHVAPAASCGPSTTPPSDRLDPTRTYRFIRRLGAGMYGQVFHAVDLRSGGDVAIKIIPMSRDNANEVLVYDREVGVLQAGASCVYVVNLVETYIFEKEVWLVMEYCEAGSLESILIDAAGSPQPLNECEAASVVKMLLLGLLHLHQRNKIHRDVKAANVLVNARGECKLADFGLSALLESTGAQANSLCGTPFFVAPEVCRRARYDAKADIWSLAVLTYVLLVGNVPYQLRGLKPLEVLHIVPASPDALWMLPGKPEGASRFSPALEKDWREQFALPLRSGWSPEVSDFLRCCFQHSPQRRWRADELLMHSWLCRVPRLRLVALEDGSRVLARLPLPTPAEDMALEFPARSGARPSREGAAWALYQDDRGQGARAVIERHVRRVLGVISDGLQRSTFTAEASAAVARRARGPVLEAYRMDTEAVERQREELFAADAANAREAEARARRAGAAARAAAQAAEVEHLRRVQNEKEAAAAFGGSGTAAADRKASKMAARAAQRAAEAERRSNAYGRPAGEPSSAVGAAAAAAGVGPEGLQTPAYPSCSPSPAEAMLGGRHSYGGSLQSSAGPGSPGTGGSGGGSNGERGAAEEEVEGDYIPEHTWLTAEFIDVPSVTAVAHDVATFQKQAQRYADATREFQSSLEARQATMDPAEVDMEANKAELWVMATDLSGAAVAHSAALAGMASAVLRASTSLSMAQINAAAAAAVPTATGARAAPPVAGNAALEISKARDVLRMAEVTLQIKAFSTTIAFAVFEGVTSETITAWLAEVGLLLHDRWVRPYAPGMHCGAGTKTGAYLRRCMHVGRYRAALRERERRTQEHNLSAAAAAAAAAEAGVTSGAAMGPGGFAGTEAAARTAFFAAEEMVVLGDDPLESILGHSAVAAAVAAGGPRGVQGNAMGGGIGMDEEDDDQSCALSRVATDGSEGIPTIIDFGRRNN